MRFIKGTKGRNGHTLRVIVDLENRVEFVEQKNEDGSSRGTLIVYGKDHTSSINQSFENVARQLGIEIGETKPASKPEPKPKVPAKVAEEVAF
jgi:hypothetical protein